MAGAYASGLLWRDDPDLLAEEATDHLAAGFRLLKMRLGRDPEYDRAAVEVVQAAIGGRAPRRRRTHRYRSKPPSGSAAWAPETWRGSREPFPPEDIDAYVQLRKASTGVPVAAAEKEFGLRVFADWFGPGRWTSYSRMCPGPVEITEGLRIAAWLATPACRW